VRAQILELASLHGDVIAIVLIGTTTGYFLYRWLLAR
jgi:hypothetical protein